jgi:tetratricopeptide (TPR) repeat protein
MIRSKAFWMAVVFAFIAAPLAAWLTTTAYAQGLGNLSGDVIDTEGKPFADLNMDVKSVETNKTLHIKTDSKGHYTVGGLAPGTYSIQLIMDSKVFYEVRTKVLSTVNGHLDVNLKDVLSKDKGAQAAQAAAEAKRAEDEKAFQDLKTHYEAGLQAINELKAAKTLLAQTPKDQQAPIEAKIAQSGNTAVTELNAALQAMKPEDPNRSVVLSQLGLAYESVSKWKEAADMYQQSIAIKPDVPANYNNLGNDLAKLGKVEEAKAAYQHYVDLDPANAAVAWRNLGAVLYQANRMKEAIEPLQKATTIDPKDAQAWLLLGIAMVNTMEFKTVGDKITPVIQPGTIEAYQKAIDLDPNGRVGAEAKQGLASLQAMGVGVDTRIGKAPTPAPAKGRK